MRNEGDGVKSMERRIDSDRLGASFLFQRYRIGMAQPHFPSRILIS